jgi:hypothetical protein
MIIIHGMDRQTGESCVFDDGFGEGAHERGVQPGGGMAGEHLGGMVRNWLKINHEMADSRPDTGPRAAANCPLRRRRNAKLDVGCVLIWVEAIDHP